MGKQSRRESRRNRKRYAGPPDRVPSEIDAAGARRFRKYLGLENLTQHERYVLRAISESPTREAGDLLFDQHASAASEKARIKWLRALEPLPSAFASLGPA